MLEENKHKDLNQDGHLNENSIAICAEWLAGKDVILSPDIKKHLEQCGQCKSDVLEISELVNSGNTKYEADNKRQEKFEESCAGKYSLSIKQVSSTQFWRVAAIFIVLITIGSLAIFIKPNKDVVLVSNEQPADTSIRDSIATDRKLDSNKEDTLEDDTEVIKIESVDRDLYAANFQANSNLEAMIGVQFRAGGNPKVMSPVGDTTLRCGDSVSFTGSNPQGGKLEIQILDNRGIIKKRYTDLEEVSQIIELTFDPGIYYWKLLDEDDLFQVGKIVLKKVDSK